MVKINLGLNKNVENNSQNHLENTYKHWREFRKGAKENYFIVPKELNEYLYHIHTRAINLYLYYCFRADNETGKSFPSVERAALDLKVSTRSINNWNDELERIGLITRISEGRSSKTTYLLPISNHYYYEKVLTPEEYIQNSSEEVDGKLKSVFHFNQWRKESKDSKDFNIPYNVTCLVYEKINKIEDVTFKIMKAILFTEKEYNEFKINKEAKDFSNDVYKFETPINEKRFEVPIIGLAVTTSLNLKERNNMEVLEFIKDLNDSLEQLDLLDSIE